MIAALAALAAGVIAVVAAEPIAAALLRARVDAQRHGSLLNAERTERTIESFNNPRARWLEVWVVRGVGVAVFVGGVIALAGDVASGIACVCGAACRARQGIQ